MTFIGAAVAIGLILALVAQAEATHYWTHRKWIKASTQTTTNAGPYCFGSSLNNVRNLGFQGSINAFGTAQNSINGLPAKWSIGPRMDFTSSCHSRIMAAFFSDPSTLGSVGLWVRSDNNFVIVGADITANKNTIWSSGGCDTTPPPYRMSYFYRHEFTHWVEFKHTAFSPPTSSTHHNFNCNAWDAFNSHDSSSLSSIYGS